MERVHPGGISRRCITSSNFVHVADVAEYTSTDTIK